MIRPALLLLLFALLPEAVLAQRLFRERRPAMGTTAEVLVHAADRPTAAALFEVAFDEIERVEQLLSDYRPTSELSRINASAGPITLDPEMARILNRALGWARQSGGAFDPTVGALVDAWRAWGDSTDALVYARRARGDSTGADPDGAAGTRAARRQEAAPEARPLPDTVRAKALARTGWQEVVLAPDTREFAFRKPGIRLDPGAFGKGYALDQAARALREAGVETALLVFGQSSYLAMEAPPGQTGWLIHVDDPTADGTLTTSVLLRNAALSTSGSHEGALHILDPRSGLPARESIQVTVVAADAMDADALSTAAFVLGPDGALPLLGSTPGVQAWIVHSSPDGPRVRTLRWQPADSNNFR